MASSVSSWLHHWPTHYFRKATFRAHVSKWWPAGEMLLATSFYVAREIFKYFNPQPVYFFGTIVVSYLFTKANDVLCRHVITLLFSHLADLTSLFKKRYSILRFFSRQNNQYYFTETLFKHQRSVDQCFSTFLMSWPTFRRDFDFESTLRKICFRILVQA